MRRYAALSFLAASFLALCLTGCQQLFTTSLASFLARKDLPIPSTLSTADAATLAAQAKDNNDTKLAAALVSSLEAQIAATTDPATKASLQATAAGAAVTASGAGTALSGLLSAVASGDTASISADTAASALAAIQAGATSSVVSALTYLDPTTGLSADQSGASASTYLLAAIVVASTAIPSGTTDPSSVDTSSLSAEQQASLKTASNLLEQAQALSSSDPSTASVLSAIGSQFSI
jgi:hypothetical protein